MWVVRPCSLAADATAWSCSSGQTLPPPRLEVCSTSTMRCGGALRVFGRMAAWTEAAVNRPSWSGERAHLHAGEGPGSAAFTMQNVGERVGEDFVAGSALDEDGDLVAHRAGRHEYGGFLAEQLGHAVAEFVGGGVLAGLLVADLGRHHRFLHGARRLSLRIGIKIHANRGGGRGAWGRVDHA